MDLAVGLVSPRLLILSQTGAESGSVARGFIRRRVSCQSQAFRPAYSYIVNTILGCQLLTFDFVL